jgi:TolA-binding protein
MHRRHKLFVGMGLCAVLAGVSLRSRADDKKPELTQAQYLEQLQVKLDHAARRASQPNSEGSSVVGLRGAKQESASKQLYWKGKTGPEAVAPDEIKAFRAAVEQARTGRNADAITSLKAFQEKYPKSALLPDVQETLARLSETPKS